MSDVVLTLCAAVVKVACKIWLKDKSFAADASADVVDIVRAKIADELDQRQARRMFEDLEVPVAKKLRALRQHEFAGMSDNEWNAAVLAVGDTLRKARFTEDDIFAGDLDPLYLRSHIAVALPTAARDLSEAGSALYDRLLVECSSYVVELTSTLPRFSVSAFGEILRRQTVILRRFEEVLSRMPSPDQERLGVTQADTEFTAAYRRQVVSQLDRLELFGVSISESIRGYPLSTAYISLAVASESLSIRRIDPATFGGSRDLPPGTLRIDDALAATTRLLLRGEAGCGKTTMLQWLAVRAARRDFPGRLAAWNETVPFLIRLRHYIDKPLGAPESFLGQLGQHMADEMPKAWIHRLLNEGRALILVDGVDELPENKRRDVRDWLSGLVTTYPNSRYVVTSRSAAASEQWLHHEGFETADVQPMSWPDVKEFIRHWHAAFRDTATDEDQRASLHLFEAGLLDALNARRHLRMIAANPLLCALICALHLDRRMHLPRDRMELYAVALDMLLERRDAERRIPDGGVSLSKTNKMLLLQDLAFWLIRNGWSDAAKERVTERITQRLHSMPHVELTGDAALGNLLLRSGLVREPVVGRIDFIHRTFEEYLAAHAAVNEDQIGELIRNAHNDQWREVVVLAAGQAQPRQRGELLLGLLDRAELEPDVRQTLQLLSVACLETCPQLDPHLHTEIERVAETLLPPGTQTQAEALARIGEPLLDLLSGRKIRSSNQAAATIRAASLIGGEAALSVVASAALLQGNLVRDEMMRAWLLFDVDEYARAVVSGSPHAKNLVVNYRILVPALRYISELSCLTLKDIDDLKDLTVVGELPQLKGLFITGNPTFYDLSPLVGHPKLEQVMLNGCRSANLHPLAAVPQLRTLSFQANTSTGLEALQKCTSLEQMELINFPPGDPLEKYLPPQRLSCLSLEGNSLQDLWPLYGVPHLDTISRLSLTYCESLESVKGIEWLADSLKSFILGGGGPIVDLSALEALRRLETLELSWYPRPDLGVIRKMPTLRHLYLDDSRPIDLDALRGIECLTIHANQTQQVTGVGLLGEGSVVVRG